MQTFDRIRDACLEMAAECEKYAQSEAWASQRDRLMSDANDWFEQAQKADQQFENSKTFKYDVKDVVILTDTFPMKGAVMTLWSDNIELIEKFKSLCYGNLPKSTHWFLQANNREYQMFEFWVPKLNVMEYWATQIAEALGLPVSIGWKANYPSDNTFTPSPIDPFDPDMHMFGKFTN